MPIFAYLCRIVAKVTIFHREISEFAALKFAKFFTMYPNHRHDIFLKWRNDWPKIEGNQFRGLQKAPKINWLP